MMFLVRDQAGRISALAREDRRYGHRGGLRRRLPRGRHLSQHALTGGVVNLLRIFLEFAFRRVDRAGRDITHGVWHFHTPRVCREHLDRAA